jgi:23S rRNA (pseudouridine1915-N3)-methyltransferase
VKLRLICVGKISAPYLQEGVNEYAGRIKRYLPLTTVELKEEKGGGKNVDPAFIRDREGERIMEKIPADSFAFVLDERGTSLNSQKLAERLDRHMVHGTRELILVLGGAYGLSATVKKRGDFLLSLSPLTFTHQMARLILLEQIYRGLTILRNEPYHNR